MNEYRIELPWPPGNNHLFSVFRGRKIKSKKGREYTAAVTQQIIEANHRSKSAIPTGRPAKSKNSRISTYTR